MNFKEINELMKLTSQLKLEEVSIETQNIKLKIKGEKQNIITNSPLNVSGATFTDHTQHNNQNTDNSNTPSNNQNIIIKAPIVGTFYSAPSPTDPPFVKQGDIIKPKQVLCIIEAMKIFNEIESEISGKIIKVLVDNNAPIEFDQPLFEVEVIN
ncbi:MAG: acetyl-CoA carboxylase biotin carboxyl carrier protein [Solitalea-like symbiont of Tyrophagus putrescentiae]